MSTASTSDNLPALATAIGPRDIEMMAGHVERSRMFNMDKSQAVALMLLCQARGLHPIEAIQRYHIIEGRPSMRADAMQAEYQAHGGVIRWVRSDAEACEAHFLHPLHAPEPGFPVKVTLKELRESGVAAAWDDKKREWTLKKNYKRHPRQMLRARVISEGVRAVLPGVIVGIYTPEEVSDMEGPKWAEARVVPPAPDATEPDPGAETGAVGDAPATLTKAQLRERRELRKPYWEFVSDKVEESNAHFVGEMVAKGVAVRDGYQAVNAWQVNRHLLKFAVAECWLEAPREKLRDRDVTRLMSGVWGDRAREVREEARRYIAEQHEACAASFENPGDAHEGIAAEDASQEPEDAAEDQADPDCDLEAALES
jgi:hypothetical protein